MFYYYQPGNGLFRVTVLTVFLLANTVLATPKITFKDPVPPANLVRVQAQRCPDPLCLNDCSFSLSNIICTVKVDSSLAWRDVRECTVKLLDENDNELGSATTNFSGTTGEIRPAWSGTKLVSCDSMETLKIKATAQEVEYDIGPQGTNESYFYDEKILQFKLHCVGCAETTRTEGNGTTKTEHSTAQQAVQLGCAILNLDTADHEVTVTILSEMGWLTPPIPPFPLPAGASAELFFDVIVPANTVDGTVDTITILSEFTGQPESSSTTAMELVIDTPASLRLVSQDGNPLLHVFGPWETPIDLQISENLITWSNASSITIPVGTEVAEESNVEPPAAPSRFFRATIQNGE